MTCKECKWWQVPTNKMGMCLKTVHGWRRGFGVMAAEWESGLYTGPDFGCIHFEEGESNIKTRE